MLLLLIPHDPLLIPQDLVKKVKITIHFLLFIIIVHYSLFIVPYSLLLFMIPFTPKFCLFKGGYPLCLTKFNSNQVQFQSQNSLQDYYYSPLELLSRISTISTISLQSLITRTSSNLVTINLLRSCNYYFKFCYLFLILTTFSVQFVLYFKLF